jgi:hypothetical protein
MSEVALALRRGTVPVVWLAGWRVTDDEARSIPGPDYVDTPEAAVARVFA